MNKFKIMQKNILLTGYSGFLGSYFYNHLKSDYKVDTLGRNSNNTIICDISKIIPQLNKKYELVIHNAGKAHHVPKTEKEKKDFFKINYQGTINLCNSLENNLPKNFIFISTIAVYGKDFGLNITESEPLLGKTPYAQSKIKAENYLQKWSKKHNVNLIILRLPLVAGKNPKGNLDVMIKGIKKGYYFNIKNNKAKKSIVLAKDIAEFIPYLINKNGIYNLAGDKDYTFKEISYIISQQLNNKKVLELPYFLVHFLSIIGAFIPYFPLNKNSFKKMSTSLTVCSEKAKKELHWNPRSLTNNFKIK